MVEIHRNVSCFFLSKILQSSSSNLTQTRTPRRVDIAPAFRDLTTACNVGQAKNGHGVCLKSVSRTTTMQGFILKAIAAADRNGQSQRAPGHGVCSKSVSSTIPLQCFILPAILQRNALYF